MSHFATTLRRCRRDANLSQAALAAKLGITRSTVTQWENDVHLPSPANVEKMDAVLHADGELIRAANASSRADIDLWPPDIPSPRRGSAPATERSLAEVFDGVGNRLSRAVLSAGSDTHRPGWGQNLGRSTRPSPWSTAMGIRTMQLLDRADVDLHAMVGTLTARQHGKGWSNRSLDVPRPEVTAVVLDALTRLGWGGPQREQAWEWLENGITGTDRRRSFVLSTVLGSVAPLRPGSPLVHKLVTDLLALRRNDGMWSASPVKDNPLAAPSIAHTARAVNALRAALPGIDRQDATEAVQAGARSILGWTSNVDGYTGVMQVDPGAHLLDVPVAHFTAAHVLHALSDVPVATIPPGLLATVRSAFWSEYVPDEGVWNWSREGRLPLWMTFDAVSALRAASLSGLYPLVAPPPGSASHRTEPTNPENDS